MPYWKFKTPDIARQSAAKIYSLFLQYKAEGDFVGMDMARKFLQMGYTRSRRYANHKSGRRYAAGSKTFLPREEDPIKARSARIFYEKWQLAKTDPEYVHTPAIAILNRVTRLIEGYESPYSLEVLAIVHWVMQADPQAAVNVERAIAAVEEWQLEQRKSFKPQHIKQAWQRLHEQRWLLAAEPA